MDKIYAVVVTYNRLELLKESINSLRLQTLLPQKVVIVNNNSTDGTDIYLSSLKNEPFEIITINLDINTGGAGGFYYGVKKCFEDGADWVWVMDDDTIASETALEKLISSPMFDGGKIFENIGFLASQVDWVNGERCRMNIPAPAWEWNWFHDKYPGCYRINAASFVSIMISRKAIETVGYPIKEFFIWFDDWEYTQRIASKPEFPCFYVQESIVVHKTPVNLGVDYADIDDGNIWKFKYGIRNEVSLNNISFDGFIRACLIIYMNLKKMRTSKRRLIHRLLILKAGLKGFFFNYRKYIEIPRL